MTKAAKRARKRENKAQARQQRVETVKRARRRRSLRSTLTIAVIVAAVVAGFSLLRSGGGSNEASDGCSHDEPKAAKTEKKTYEAAPEMKIDPAKRYSATIETSCGDITVDLDPKAAPLAVNSFVFLARERFFDGLTWHRVVNDFVIQSGDPEASGSGGPGYTFEDELPDTDYQPGDLAMANSGKDTNGSQFFILTADQARDISQHGHTRFGKVTKGLDVAREIESFAPKGAPEGGKPTKPLYIVKVTIEESAS